LSNINIQQEAQLLERKSAADIRNICLNSSNWIYLSAIANREYLSDTYLSRSSFRWYH